jgi:hypothetical protein
MIGKHESTTHYVRNALRAGAISVVVLIVALMIAGHAGGSPEPPSNPWGAIVQSQKCERMAYYYTHTLTCEALG